MNRTLCLSVVLLLNGSIYAQKPAASLVDYNAFEELVKEVKVHRAQRLLPLEQFLAKSKAENTVILDTRSKEMYDRKHLAGAVHLNFSDFTQQNLDNLMRRYAGSQTQILIYCNNNFSDRTKINLQDLTFVTKVARPLPIVNKKSNKPAVAATKTLTLALNIPTYINLYGYGYTNVYELSELVDVSDRRIKFEGTDVAAQ